MTETRERHHCEFKSGGVVIDREGDSYDNIFQTFGIFGHKLLYLVRIPTKYILVLGEIPPPPPN